MSRSYTILAVIWTGSGLINLWVYLSHGEMTNLLVGAISLVLALLFTAKI